MIIYNNIFQTIAGSTNEPVKVTVEELKALIATIPKLVME